MTKPAILLIGGVDPQGCAGLSADIQTVSAHGCHAISLVTCLTEQTSQGLTALGALSTTEFMAQYQSAIADFDIQAIKIGLIPDCAIAGCVAQIVGKHQVPVIWDPVLASTSGGLQVGNNIQSALNSVLAKITLLTPNLPELKQLTGIANMEEATQQLFAGGLQACLVKGGHAESQWATDYFDDKASAFYCYSAMQSNKVRGTGCVLASSIACHLALKHDIRDAIVLAKAYLNRGIRQAKTLGPYAVFEHGMADIVLTDMPKLCYSADVVGKTFNFPKCPLRLGIYPVVDSSDWVQKLTQANIKTIQLRIKDMPDAQKSAEIKEAANCCDASIAFFVNDYWQQAIAHNAYGVHLGQEDLHDANLMEIELAGLRLGISTHSYWELARALAINPSYIALGPVFATTSKEMPWIPQGVERVRQWEQLLGDEYPLVAIGGIDLPRARQLKQTGVGSVAMISAITQAEDYREATAALLACWRD